MKYREKATSTTICMKVEKSHLSSYSLLCFKLLDGLNKQFENFLAGGVLSM